jgi:hypothetical protein
MAGSGKRFGLQHGIPVQITKKMIRVNKAVRDRRAWSKFGDCDGQEV